MLKTKCFSDAAQTMSVRDVEAIERGVQDRVDAGVVKLTTIRAAELGAVQDLLADIAGERAEVMKLAMDQHADAFAAPAAPEEVADAKPIDAALAQELRNSIAEGEGILKYGRDSIGKKMSAEKLAAVQRSVDSAKEKLGDADAPRFSRNAGNAGISESAASEYSADKPYEQDIFGNAVSAPATGALGDLPRQPTAKARDLAATAAISAPEGRYATRAALVTTRKQQLGHFGRVTDLAGAANALAYLNKSAVERLDGLLTDAKGKPLAIIGGFKGALSQAAVYPATLLGEAMQVPGAANLWLVHNHPSGSSILSRADELLGRTIAEVFDGTSIKVRGMLAVAPKTWGGGLDWDNFSGTYSGDISPASGPTVPVQERQIVEDGKLGPAIDDPRRAKALVAAFVQHNMGRPTIVLLDAQHIPVAAIPWSPEDALPLKGNGKLDALFRAVAQSNAAAALIGRGGPLATTSATGMSVAQAMNIGAALHKADVRVLDIIDRDGGSAAERGESLKADVLFSRDAAANTDRSATPSSDPQAQAKAQSLNDALDGYLGKEWSNSHEAVELPDSLSGIGEAIQAALGRDVQPVAPTAARFDIFNGSFIPSQPKTVYINVKANASFVQVAFHELWHSLKRSRPDLAAWYRQQAAAYYKNVDEYQAKLNKLLEPGEKPYGKEAALEELDADFLGDSMADLKFLQQLADASPTKFRALLNSIRLWLTKIAGKMRGLKSEQYVSDVEALRAHLKEVLVAFADGKPLESLSGPKPGSGALFSSAATEKPDAWVYRFWGERTWANEQEARESIRRRIVEDNERYAGLFKANDAAIVDGLVFSGAPKGQVKLKQPRQQPASFARIGEPADSEGSDRPDVDWTSADLVDDGTPDSALQAYGRGKGNVYRAWIDTDIIPKPKGDGIVAGYPDTDGGYDWRELGHTRSATPPLKVRVGANGKIVLMDGNHRLAWWREQGKSEVPAYVIDERKGSEDVLFSRKDTSTTSSGSGANSDSAHSWNSPEPSRFDDLLYKYQDSKIDTKRVVDAIRAMGKSISDDLNVYQSEELFHGRAAARNEDFINKELNPLLVSMKMRGIDLATLDEFLHARHAEEANILIAERNPDEPGLQDGGSGMKTGEARKYLAKLDPAQRKHLEAVAAKVDTILAGTKQLYADYHLESDATIKGWNKMFKHYVPLMREDKGGGMGIGQGISIKGRESKGRTGSTRKVVDIFANIAMQRERAIVRGEKNRVATALVGLVDSSPNPDFWTSGKPPTERVYDPKTNTVVDRADPLYKSRENVVVAKIKLKDGSVEERAVIFNEDNERAVRMAAALKNLDASQLEGLLATSAKITRYFSAINTQYNPIFGIVNLVRDIQGALLNLTSTKLKDHKAEVAGHTLSALKGIYADMRAARNGKTPTSKWAALWEEFQDEGGQTGYRDMFANSADRVKAIEQELNPTAWMDSPLGKVFTAGGALKVPLAIAQKQAVGLFGWLSDYNASMENAVRLSAYKVGLEQGMTKPQAASLAKNLTVNFNRKGQVGQQAGALYAFFNASMQGTARIGKTLFDIDGSDVKSIRLSSTGKKIVYGGVMLGVAQALALAAAGFDDDEPPDFVRERSLIIPTGGKTYITIPMPLGLNILPNLGRITTEFALGGFKNPTEKVFKLLGMAVNAFNPIGGGASIVQMLSPTAIDPLVALAENKDWTGKPIAKTSYNKATPGHALARDTASYPAKLLSEAINTLSGGTQYTAGVMSPTPDQIDYLWGQVTGGVGREVSKAQQSISAIGTGEDLPIHKIPLVGRFYGDADTPSSQSGRFYENINRLNKHEAELKGLRKDGKGAEASEYMAEHQDARLFVVANKAEREVQKLRHRKSELIAKDAPREQVKAIENQIALRMTMFNAAIRRQNESQNIQRAP